MKKITLLISGLVFAAFTYTIEAQTYDVGVTGLPNVFTNMPVYPNVPMQIQYTRQNFGAAISNTVVDSFTMEIHVDQIKRQTFYRNMSTAFGVGASETTGGATNLNWGTLGISAGPVSVCAQTRIWKNGVMIDANTSNDQSCVVVNYSGDNNPFTYDMSISDVLISDIFTEFANGDTVEPSMFLDKVWFNLGNTDVNNGIPSGIEFNVMATMDGVSSGPYKGTLTNPLGPGGSAKYSIAGLSLPSGKTSFDVCIELVPVSDDINHNNDKSCSTFHVRDYTGISDVEEQDVTINYTNGRLFINMMDNAVSSVDLKVISISGQMVHSETFSSNGNDIHEVNLSKLNSGVYVAIVTNENGLTEKTRFVVE